MRVYDIIEKKRNGEKLTDDEIKFIINEYVMGNIPDYQISALLMAIYFKGMDDEETYLLTDAMMHSGDVIDLSEFGDLSVDKHSTGGVGDKTTLVVAPVVAALGCKISKMSGRGLGHTGGTVDKLESIQGFKVNLQPDAFFNQVRKIGISVIGSTSNLAPADKKLYALRDVTATIDSIPLIASSIMSKKLASGAKNIVLDVKIGSGAFMKSEERARELANKMVEIGKRAGKNIAAVITNMDRPLGYAVGNSVEVLEAVSVLKGEDVPDFKEVCVTIASNLVSLCYGWSEEFSRKKVLSVIENGKALEKFREWIIEQGGNDLFIDDETVMGHSKYSLTVRAGRDGYISHMDTESIGKAAAILGAGRQTIADKIDYTAGIILKKKTGDSVKVGEKVATLYTNSEKTFSDAIMVFENSLEYSAQKPEEQKIIFDIIK